MTQAVILDHLLLFSIFQFLVITKQTTTKNYDISAQCQHSQNYIAQIQCDITEYSWKQKVPRNAVNKRCVVVESLFFPLDTLAEIHEYAFRSGIGFVPLMDILTFRMDRMQYHIG